MFWCWLAEKISMPIYKIIETVPETEIRLWRTNYNTKHERYEIEHWYLAQIAAEIRQAGYRNNRVWRVKDLLIKFVVPEPLKPMPLEEQKRIVGNWLGCLRAVCEKKGRKKK